jgi:predicted helicase
LQTILGQFCRSNRDLWDRFERLMQQFLRTHPLFAPQFSEAWMWNEWLLKAFTNAV